MALIGISGKIGSGKDTVGDMIRFIHEFKLHNPDVDIQYKYYNRFKHHVLTSDWQIKKFADKLKQIASILTGIPVKDFEKQEVKDAELGKEWIRYAYADGFAHHYKGGEKVDTVMDTIDCDEERYKQELKVNWQTAYKTVYTGRLLLQRLGTEAMRKIIHPDVWCIALFADYKGITRTEFPADAPIYGIPTEEDEIKYGSIVTRYPKWIITDVRFVNEANAIKERNGLLIRINRPNSPESTHQSEIDLDTYPKFDIVLNNDGTLKDLFYAVLLIYNKYNLYEAQ